MCYGQMAAVITSRFPEKTAECWAYQTTIIHADHTYEGADEEPQLVGSQPEALQ